MGNSHIVPLQEVNIFVNSHIQEYDENKVIIARNNNNEKYIVLYYHNDISNQCYEHIKHLKNTDSITIYHYKGKLMGMRVNEDTFYAKNVLPGSQGCNLDLEANI